MLTLAITGGLCSGKSLVTAVFREGGWPVLDADRLGHTLLEPGQEAAAEIAQYFGRDILDAAGRIDRRKLGERVFGPGESAAAARLALNAMLHPRIRAAMRQTFAEWADEGHTHAAAEVALLIESGLHRNFDRVLLVVCPDELKIERYIRREAERDGFGREYARAQAVARLAAQLPDEQKRAAADFVVDNSGDPARTRAQVQEVIASL